MKVILLLLLLSVSACSGELSTTSVGSCMSGERQLHSSGVLQTPQGPITLTAPAGTNLTLCTW
jgi:hypothetical protein